MIESRDVVVVGGGLVGSALALDLTQRGISVTVLERSRVVPDLLRGESIMPAGAQILETLGVADSLSALCRETEGVVLHHPAFAEGPLVIDYDAAPLTLYGAPGCRPRGLCGWRQPLYEGLREALERRGVELLSGYEVVGVRRQGDDHVVVPRDSALPSLRTPMLVAADGYTSRLRQLKGFLPVRAEQPTWVAGFVLRAPGYTRARVQVAAHPLGAAFVFPFLDGHVRVTFECTDLRRAEVAGSDLLTLLGEAVPQLADELREVEVVSARQVQPGRRIELASLVEDGFALVGDAAGCLDPFAGYGMTNGLEDARSLAEVIAAGDVRARALRAYESERQARFARRSEATDTLAYAFLDKTEGLGQALAARLSGRWRDERILPLVAAEFAGFTRPLEPSMGMRLHCLGLL